MAVSRKGRGVWMLVAALAALPAWGQSSQPDLRAQDAQDTDAFLNRHPDLRYRKLGKEAQARGRLEEARRFYRLGARHADKLSQAALAEMWWNGQGGGQDRALAYAWMDLAAERGTEFLLVLRERYWAALTPDEQTRAVQEGQAVYAEFGDTVAQPRLERELRRGLSEVTGSRTGSVGGMRMLVRDDRSPRNATATPSMLVAGWPQSIRRPASDFVDGTCPAGAAGTEPFTGPHRDVSDIETRSCFHSVLCRPL